MRTLINRVLNLVKYHFVGYKVDIIQAEITIGKLTSRIDNNYDRLNDKYDDLEQDINDYYIELEKSIKKIDKRVKELEPSELHEMLQTPFKDNDVIENRLKLLENVCFSGDDMECNICDDVGRTCAELQTELDKVIKQKNELMVKYKALRNNINLTNEKE